MGRIRFISVAIAILTANIANAQSESERLTAQIESLTKRLEALENKQEQSKIDSFYTPQLYGSMMAYFNVNTYDGDQRFAVRNAQIGVKGNASNNASYCIQVNFNNLASISVLDSYIRYKAKSADLTLGQQWIHITSDFDRTGPKTNIFPSRSFGVVYISSYTNGTAVKSFGIRDIGLYGNYTFKGEIPITLSAGAFNGAGANSIAWDNDINLTGRVQIGGKKGLSGGGSIYGGTTAYDQSVMILSGELRYVNSKIFVEANYQHKTVEMSSDDNQTTTTGLIQGYYTIKTPKSKLLDSYAPTLRYDFGEGMLYSNLSSGEVEEQSAGRISALMSFMLKGSKIRSRFSLGYEKVFMDEKPSDYADNPLFQDRFTAAMTVVF
ncbi:MAG: porin [Rikenellaceae bacterium]